MSPPAPDDKLGDEEEACGTQEEETGDDADVEVPAYFLPGREGLAEDLPARPVLPPALPPRAPPLLRWSALHRILMLFSVRPGSLAAMRDHLLPSFSWTLRIVSSSWRV